MNSRLILLLSVLVMAFASGAQAATYGYAPEPFNWIDNTAHTDVVWTGVAGGPAAECTGGYSVVDDDITQTINLGFNFTYGGTTYSQARIMSNGRLQFANTYCYYGTQTVGPPPTYTLPYPNANLNNTMRIYGADFCPNGGGTGCGGRVTYATLTAPNRFVVTWSQMREWNSGTSLFNVQFILYDTGDFVYQYKDIANVSQGAGQIGWQLSAADYGLVDMTTVNSLAYSAIRFYKPTLPLAEYRFDECSGTGAADSSGNGYDGTASAGVTPGSPGRLCTAFNFNRTTGYVGLPASFPKLGSAVGYTSFTIAAWFNSTNVGLSGQRIFVDDQNNTGGFAVSLGDPGSGSVRFFSRAVNPISFDSPAVVTPNAWHFVAAIHDAPTKTRTLMIYDAAGNLLSNTSQVYTGTWGSDAGAAALGGENAASTENNSNFRFSGWLDEVKVFSRALAASEIRSIYGNEAQGLQADGSLRYCAPCATSLGDFNAFESSTPAGAINGVVKTKVAGAAFSASTGNIDIVALNAGRTAVDASYSASNVRVELLDASAETGAPDANGCYAGTSVITTTGNQSVNSGRGTISASPNIANAYPRVRLRVFAPPGSPTRIGCSTDVFAIRPSYFNVAGAAAQDSNWQAAGTSRTLNNLVASGGAVHAAGRPFSLSGIVARMANNATATNYAGQPTVAPGNLVLPDPIYCLANGYPCRLGTFNVAGWGYASGVLSSGSASYSEAGSFSWEIEDRTFADVYKGDSTASQRYFRSNAVLYSGRFVPDSYRLALTNTPQLRTFGVADGACHAAATAPKRTFTYLGQPYGYATAPSVRVTGLSYVASGAAPTTQNYLGVVGSGGLWKLATPLAYSSATCTAPTQTCAALRQDGGGNTRLTATYTYASSGATPGWDGTLGSKLVVNDATLTSANDGSGTLVLATTDRVTLRRDPTTPVVGFNADVSLALQLDDLSETAVANNGTISGNLPAAVVAFDSGKVFRYGRGQLTNGQGVETLDLDIPFETQYWNGTAFVTNTADNCTPLAAVNFVLTSFNPAGFGANFTSPSPHLTVGATPLGGVAMVKVLKPNPVAKGSLTLCLDSGLGPCTGTTAAAFDYLNTLNSATGRYENDPSATVTFGVTPSTRPIIYIRERY